MSLAIYYDGACPFCAKYVQLTRLRESVGDVRLVNLREHKGERDALSKQGYDLDKGMVVDTGQRVLSGSDAVQTLAMLSTRSGFFNRINHTLLSNPTSAAFLYPILRAGRWMALLALGREGFATSTEGLVARASIFGIFFSLFSLFHVLNLTLEYGRFPPSWDSTLIFATALALLLKPSSPRLLFLLMLASTVSTIVQMPIQSNHMMVRAFCLLGYWMAFIWCAARSLPWHEVFRHFAPAGQAALVIMYVFGIFHKINSDFLNPEASCAVALWREMPLPLRAIDGPLMHYTAIYGTFVLEGIIIVLLFVPRLRHFGIVAGIAFHMLLALSSYAMYISFTTLAMALHALFLSEASAGRIWRSTAMRMVVERSRNPAYIALALVLISAAALAAIMREYSITTMLGMLIVVPFCALVIRYGGLVDGGSDRKRPNAAHAIGGIVAVLFFANCFMPYLGLKSAQTVNMFANLRLEAGVSNHLLFPQGPGPFTYLDEVAIIESASADSLTAGLKRQGLHMVFYDLLAEYRRHPEMMVTFTLGDQRFVDATASDFAREIDQVLMPEWVNKWFHFQPVSLAQPETCNV